MRNVDIHDDWGVESIRKDLKPASERYFDTEILHDNPLIVATANYLFDSAHAGASYRRRS